MRATLSKTKGISTFPLIILLLACLTLGAVLSYLWTEGYYAYVGHKVPEDTTTTVITNVTFPIKNSRYFNVTVLNPSYSKADGHITRIAIVAAVENVESIFEIQAESIEPSIPYTLLKSESVTFKCSRNWQEFAGQTVSVVVFLQDESGATFPYETSRVKLEVVGANFDTTVTIKSFNVTVRNSPESSISLNVTEILFDSVTIPIQNISIQDENVTFPKQLLPSQNETFTCQWNLWEQGFLGDTHTITVETLQGYMGIYETESLPPTVSFNITSVAFTQRDTSGFNITVFNSPSSPHFINVSSVSVMNGTQAFRNIPFIGETAQGLLPGENHTFQCSWEWKTFKGQEVKIVVHTIQGFYSEKLAYAHAPPVALFTESKETANTEEIITFNASRSYDPDGTIASFFWDFGDGDSATEILVNHTYADDGFYVVTLTVTDDDGFTDKTNATKTILNRPPIASFVESASTILVNETAAFNASDSFDPDGSVVSYLWNFGDETNDTGIYVSHVYASNGTFTVTLTVKDDDGASNSINATMTVTSIEQSTASRIERGETHDAGASIASKAMRIRFDISKDSLEKRKLRAHEVTNTQN